MHGKTRRRWKKLIEMQEASGLSVKEFSRKIGVHYSQFFRQYKAIKEKSFGKKKATCVAETGRHSLVGRKAESDAVSPLLSTNRMLRKHYRIAKHNESWDDENQLN